MVQVICTHYSIVQDFDCTVENCGVHHGKRVEECSDVAVMTRGNFGVSVRTLRFVFIGIIHGVSGSRGTFVSCSLRQSSLIGRACRR